MKKTLALLLAVLMVAAMVPMLGIGVAAEGEPAPAPGGAEAPIYQIYQQNFEGLAVGADKETILDSLGWYVPESKIASDVADYTVVEDAGNKSLRVSTISPIGLENESFLTVFDGEAMHVLRNSTFTLSYDLTYRAGTTNYDGYSALVYNYNGRDGVHVSETTGEAYGLVAIRACGTGIHAVYYPVQSGSTMCVIEDEVNSSANVLANCYSRSGAYPSLYGRLFLEDGDPEATAVRRDTGVLIDKTLHVSIDYDYNKGTKVTVNGVLVSTTSLNNYTKYSNTAIWNDFVIRNTNSAIALVTKHNVVADIDNIEIISRNIGSEKQSNPVPDLVITEMSNTGFNSNNAFYEFIEIYNPTDDYVDFSQYSIAYADNVTDGDLYSVINGNRGVKYANYVNLNTVVGKPLVSSTNYYLSEDVIATMDSSRYTYVNENKYIKEGSTWVVSASGNNRCIHYVDTWNANYQGTDTSDYMHNSLLKPGDCLVIFVILDATENCWKAGINGGKNNTTAFSTSGSVKSFRDTYKNRGLTSQTKVISFRNYNLADNVNRRYSICDAYDANGKEINYKNSMAMDFNQIVSCIDFQAPIAYGLVYEGADVIDTDNLGKGGTPQYSYSGTFIYGVDNSADFRRGTLYMRMNKVDSGTTHVGALEGYQEVTMAFYAHPEMATGELSITEIAPRTQTLAGEDKNAFSAMEITNTSDDIVNLYNYRLVRTESNQNAAPGKGFTRAISLKAGNPVTKGEGNGAYYYFVEDHIVNPDSFKLDPGETAVLWFLGDDTYTTYSKDDDFGVDYFRQYWVNQGNNALGEKDANGEYSVKVLAVDGNVSATSNKDNAKTVFDLSYTDSAVYGISKSKTGAVPTNSVINIAHLSVVSTHYQLRWTPIEFEGVTYLANVLDCTKIPVNTSMHYIVGTGFCPAVSTMANTLKVQYYEYNTSGRVYYSTKPLGEQTPVLQFETSEGMQQPDLGRLAGEETSAIAQLLFASKTEGDVTTYYIDPTEGASVKTLQGAALSTGADTKLRFDNSITAASYNKLAPAGAKFGMIIAKTADVAGKELTKAALDTAGVTYTDAKLSVLVRGSSEIVLSATLDVAAADYGTSYTAIAYIEIPESETIYSSVSTAASVKSVATAALADTVLDESTVYAYPNADGKYSRYTQAFQATLQSYIGA